jgi:hypothetical protein
VLIVVRQRLSSQFIATERASVAQRPRGLGAGGLLEERHIGAGNGGDMKVVEVLGEVVGKLIELVRTVVMAGWGPVFRLAVVLLVIAVLVVVGGLGLAGSR